MLILLLACGDKAQDTATFTDTAGCTPDLDGDGYCSGDCNDGDPAIHPDAAEECNDLDDNCDGSIDEGAGATWYLDEDGDGYGGESITACDAPDSYADNGSDCDDSSASTYPGAEELSDGLDNDCDGDIDEGITEATVEIDITWSSSGVQVDITGTASSYEFGMAETGVGVDGWYGESCIPGDEPWGYSDYGYDICHTLSSGGGFIDSTSALSDVTDGVTLFSSSLAPDITYFVGAGADCWVLGDDPSYYDDFGCEAL